MSLAKCISHIDPAKLREDDWACVVEDQLAQRRTKPAVNVTTEKAIATE